MTLIEALVAPQCAPFTIALGVMVAIAIIEGVGAVVGLSVNAALSELFDIDAPDADVDGEAGGALSKTLGWLRIGRVPVLIALIVALTLFGLAGLAAQALAASVIGTPVSAWIAAPAIALAVLPVVRAANGAMGRMMPGEETEVVTRASLAGHTGVVTIGPVSAEVAGQCRVRDRHGQLHHPMIVADEPGEIATGEKVLLVEEEENRWKVIAAQAPQQ